MPICNRLDLESLGSWLTMPKNFSGIGWNSTETLVWESRPHTAEVGEFYPWHVPQFEEPRSSFLGGLKFTIDNFQLESRVLNLTQPPSWIGVENKRFHWTKEGPYLRPSSRRLGTYQGRKVKVLRHIFLLWACVTSIWIELVCDLS